MTMQDPQASAMVALVDIAARLGAVAFDDPFSGGSGVVGTVQAAARALGRDLDVEVATDWTGQPAVTVETAAAMLSTALEHRERESERQTAYRLYLEQRRRAAAEAREAEAIRRREEQVAEERRVGKARAEEARRRAEAAERAGTSRTALQRRQRAMVAGDPVDYADFDPAKHLQRDEG